MVGRLVIFKKTDVIGTITAYLPKNNIFAVKFKKEWIRFDMSEDEFLDRVQFIEENNENR